MLNTKRSLAIIFCILSFQIIIYALFFRPCITTWGASEEEAAMQLIGDDLTPSYNATRAILLNAPMPEAWQAIISLGADRGGFYSYSFMEDMAGYVGKTIDKSNPKIYDMKVGRIVPGALDESDALVKRLVKEYGWTWPVTAVDPGRSYVLQGWGAFVLKEVTPTQTRLIVRTHEGELPDLGSKISNFIIIPLHYIMERRMMIGFKAQFEPDIQPSYIGDIFWFIGLILSFFGIFVLVFIFRGIQSVLLPGIFGVFWLFVLLVFDPLPQYSIILSAMVMALLGRYFYRTRSRSLIS
jgi:hypothetical protein